MNLNTYRFIFIGEQHGSHTIPQEVFSLLQTISGKILFFVELPQEAEKYLQDYFNGNIDEQTLYAVPFLHDAVDDKRLRRETLDFYKKLFLRDISLYCLERYDGKPEERDKHMAERFLDIVAKEKADHYIIYMGHVHLMKKKEFLGIPIDPLVLYLPENILREALILQFFEKDDVVYYEREDSMNE